MNFVLAALEDGVAHVRLSGRVSQEELSPFSDAFQDHLGPTAYQQQVLVDLTDVEWLDSSGVSWLLSSLRKFREAGGGLVLHSIPPNVRDVLRVLNLHKTFKIAGSADEAQQLVRGEEV